MTDRTAPVKDPVTAYLAAYIDQIKDEDYAEGVRQTAHYANGYLQALYDIERIRPETLLQQRMEIDRVKKGCLEAIVEEE